MAYVDFPEDLQGQKNRKQFWLSTEGLTLISGWRRNGVPLTKIAEEYIGIKRTTWWHWYKENENLRQACAVSLDVANLSVEESLLKRALGYDYVERTYDLIEGELRLAHEYHRHMPPDTKAILAWLYNRLPNQWRSIQEPLEQTQYVDTIKNILISMKEVAEKGTPVEVEIKEDTSEASE